MLQSGNHATAEMVLVRQTELPADVLVAIAGRLSTRDVFSLIFCCRGTLALSKMMLAGRRLACSTPTTDLAPEALRRCLRLLGKRWTQLQDPQMLVGASVATLGVLREWGLALVDVCRAVVPEWDPDFVVPLMLDPRDFVVFDPPPPTTVLERVAFAGNADLLRALGEWGLTLQEVRAHDNRVLRAAARHGHVGLLRVLRGWGLTATDARARENSALRMAAANGHVAVLELFRGWGLGAEDVAAREYESLRWAIQRNHVDVLRLLATWGVGAAQFRANQNALLGLAALLGRVEVIGFLREVGLTVDDARDNKNVALQLAARHGHVEAMRCLWAWGLTLADVRADNNAVLRMAASLGDVAVMRVLREWGLTPAEAKRAVAIATFHQSAEATQFLREWSSPPWRRFISWLVQ